MPIAYATEEVQRIETAQGVLDAFNRIATLFTSIVVALAVAYVIYNGFMFVSAGGDETKIATAKKQIIYTLIAIFLIIIAGSAFRIVGGLISDDSGPSDNQTEQSNTDSH